MIKITEKIKQRLSRIEQTIEQLRREQIEIVNIYLDSIEEEIPKGSNWKTDATGDHIIIAPIEAKEEIIEEKVAEVAEVE